MSEEQKNDRNNPYSESAFSPPWYLKGPMVQTLLNSARFRNRGVSAFDSACSQKIIDAGEGVRLQGFLSEQTNRTPVGFVILFHGWEGSEKSAYMVSTGRYFYERGFNVFRLNMRDHGNSHHLNDGFFLGTLIEEAYEAVKEVIRRYSQGMKAFLAGFSMGANFCIRVAKKASEEGYSGLHHVFAVNPPVDPLNSTRRVDEVGFIRQYFLRKWKDSLLKKQTLFPGKYDFRSVLSMDRCIPMTELLLEQYTSYTSLEEYFGRYTLKEGFLEEISIPFSLLTSRDDPIIPYEDIASAKMSSSVNFLLQKRGGHCGYIRNCRLESWYLPVMFRSFS